MVLGERVHQQEYVLELCHTYLQLDDRRRDFDQQIMNLSSDDPKRDVLWQELEANLADLRNVIGQLAKSPAVDVVQLRAKAVVLARVLRSRGADGDSPIISNDESIALALTIADEITQLLN